MNRVAPSWVAQTFPKCSPSPVLGHPRALAELRKNEMCDGIMEGGSQDHAAQETNYTIVYLALIK
jgi:hypothetical protein